MSLILAGNPRQGRTCQLISGVGIFQKTGNVHFCLNNWSLSPRPRPLSHSCSAPSHVPLVRHPHFTLPAARHSLPPVASRSNSDMCLLISSCGFVFSFCSHDFNVNVKMSCHRCLAGPAVCPQPWVVPRSHRCILSIMRCHTHAALPPRNRELSHVGFDAPSGWSNLRRDVHLQLQLSETMAHGMVQLSEKMPVCTSFFVLEYYSS